MNLAPDGELTPHREVYTVSRLNREARTLLDNGFPPLWVEGELSNFSCPASGHWYFSLKDQGAQVRCAMFRVRNQSLAFRPTDGIHVLARARVGLYEARGDFQLIVEHLEEAGDGLRQRAFEEIKRRLAQEGLFEEAHKKPLPSVPRAIGVVTSPSGAAIHDILHVLKRRFPAIPVILYPSPVQGAGAAGEIARMIRLASARLECDVLIVARGGGTLEDLWAYNEESVARALYDCRIPVVSGIGHQIDFTVADLVADRRAPTPSAAAELVSPDREQLGYALSTLRGRLLHGARKQQQNGTQWITWLRKRLEQQDPRRALREKTQRLDELEWRLRQTWTVRLQQAHQRLAACQAHLKRQTPAQGLRQRALMIEGLMRRLTQGHRRTRAQCQARLAELGRALDAVSPLATLARGYAIVRRPDGIVVRASADVTPGMQVETRLARGCLRCTVDETWET